MREVFNKMKGQRIKKNISNTFYYKNSNNCLLASSIRFPDLDEVDRLNMDFEKEKTKL